MSTASATTMSRRTAVPGLLPVNSCVSPSVGSSRRPRRPTKISFVPSRTETTLISHDLTHELSQCSFTQLPTTAQRAFHTQSQTLIHNVHLKRSLNSFCRFILRIFRKRSQSRGSSDATSDRHVLLRLHVTCRLQMAPKRNNTLAHWAGESGYAPRQSSHATCSRCIYWLNNRQYCPRGTQTKERPKQLEKPLQLYTAQVTP